MAACQQDAQWHAEGDVWTHTRMVCAELERLADWPSLDRAAQLKLLFTALSTTLANPQNKRRTNPVPESVILRLVEKLEPPIVTECHSLTFG